MMHLPQRRRAEGGKTFRPVGLPVSVAGLCDLSVLEAAAVDGEDIPWRVAGVEPHTAGTYNGSRNTLIALMERCLNSDPAKRPSLNDLQTALRAVPH